MPRVSSAHVAARKTQIIDAARICFLRKGFHETSMQDIFRQSGLSSGAVYLYFKSKDELITALVEELIRAVQFSFEGALNNETVPPLERLPEHVIRHYLAVSAGTEFERLAVQIWSESQHNPAVARLTDMVFSLLLQLLTQVVDAYKERGIVPISIASESVARVVASIVHGFMLQRSFDPELDPDVFLAGLQAFG